MPRPTSESPYLSDRAAIHDLHVRYFQGIDRGDLDQVRACFTEDVEAVYGGGSTLRGRDALIEALLPSLRSRAGEQVKVSMHFMGNLAIEMLGSNEAETETYAIAFIVTASAPADRLLMRGLRYLDRLRREGDIWRISQRQHTLDWSTEAPATFAVTQAQRVLRLPVHPSQT